MNPREDYQIQFGNRLDLMPERPLVNEIGKEIFSKLGFSNLLPFDAIVSLKRIDFS